MFFLNIANTNVSESNANTTFLNGTFTNQMIAEYIPTLVDSISLFFVRRKFRFLSVPKYSKIIQNLMLVGYDIFFFWLESHTTCLQPPLGQSQLSYTPGESGIGLPEGTAHFLVEIER